MPEPTSTSPRRLALGLACALLGACDPTPPVPTDGGGELDAPAADAGTDAPLPPDVCDELGLPRARFVTTGTGTGLADIAGDFTAATTAGTFTLSESFSGCESYVFFVHLPGISDALIRTPPDRTFLEGPRNVRYFYLSDDTDPGARAALMAELETSVSDGLGLFVATEEERAFWRARFHFVTDRATEVSGSVGAFLRDYFAYAGTPAAIVDLGGGRGRSGPPYPVAFAIDRAQAWDPVDSLNPSVGEGPNLGMAAWLGHFYNYRFDLEARLARETGVTVVSLLDETTTGRLFTREVTLPAAATTADALEVDVVVDCRHGNPFGCSEWDRIASVSYCADGAACTDRREIARWITPYWRRGRQHYAIDATPFLGLLRAGGAQTFFVELGPEWERPTEWTTRVSLRFRDGGGERTTGTELAFGGGAFGADYNCGNGTCDVGETAEGCFDDCGTSPTCGDARCEGGEDGTSCASDCPATCGDGTCDAAISETRTSCPADCYRPSHPPFSFTPPAGTTRVELVTILSGHGQVAGNNCAEWCDHRHTFSVNGTALPTIVHSDAAPIGSAMGCAAHAVDGWMPGQWGNGAPMRAYWCPGLPVVAERVDITASVTVGSPNELTYLGTYRAGAPMGGDIALSAYVVYYAAR